MAAPEPPSRRQRVHELALALLARQSEIELLSPEATGGGGEEAGLWLERNRRVVLRYQAVVRSAITLDALIEQEVGAGAGQL
ncbi:hypothetical protein KQ304_03270 [Synechococcus sp. CS-1329]|uniref:hypothetical protein n=1 Tax=Synechococcus sp. CS-1329 TaxID=2847975 RepID=UPI00223BCE79|nr:hypothetical protein [Synechococcus sp. CS-1329]MCT0218025.1 hypothetical protein [Synechococcus sp. CS-1329]